MTKRRAEGHIFRAWCGGEYIFRADDKGQLSVQPHRDPWQFIRDWRAIERAMTRACDPYVGMTREMRREEKARTFHARYAGSQDHRWRTQIPHENGTQGRMVIHDVPFEF